MFVIKLSNGRYITDRAFFGVYHGTFSCSEDITKARLFYSSKKALGLAIFFNVIVKKTTYRIGRSLIGLTADVKRII